MSFVGQPLPERQRQPFDYDGIRFMIDVLVPDGSMVPLIDGGAFDWLRKLTSNNNLVM